MGNGQSFDFSLSKKKKILFLILSTCRFLFDESCSDYKYYDYRLSEEEKALSQTTDVQTSLSG